MVLFHAHTMKWSSSGDDDNVIQSWLNREADGGYILDRMVVSEQGIRPQTCVLIITKAEVPPTTSP